MAFLSQEQYLEIREIIELFHYGIIHNVIGESYVPEEILEKLKDWGILNPGESITESAYLLGQLNSIKASIDPIGYDQEMSKIRYDTIKKELVALKPEKDPFEKFRPKMEPGIPGPIISETQEIKLEPGEKPMKPIQASAFNFARRKGFVDRDKITFQERKIGQYIRGLGNKIEGRMSSVILNQEMIEADKPLRARMEELVQDATSAAIARKDSIGGLASDLRRITGDSMRDWDRVAETELNNAYQEGTKQAIVNLHATEGDPEGQNIRIAKIPASDACEHCKKAYLNSDGTPKIFTIGELEANGSNAHDPAIHKKTGGKRSHRRPKEYLPTIESLHPHCKCQQVAVMDGYEFDASGRQVPDKDLKEKVAKVKADRAERRALKGLDKSEDQPDLIKAANLTSSGAGTDRVVTGTFAGNFNFVKRGRAPLKPVIPGRPKHNIVEPEMWKPQGLQLGQKIWQPRDVYDYQVPIPRFKYDRFLPADAYKQLKQYRKNEPAHAQSAATAWRGNNHQAGQSRYILQPNYYNRQQNNNTGTKQAYDGYLDARDIANYEDAWPAVDGAYLKYQDLDSKMIASARMGRNKGKARFLKSEDSKPPHTIHYYTEFQGIPIAIENTAGTYRYWYDENGNESGKTRMLCAYGYVPFSEGLDGDEVDVYMGGNPYSKFIYIITQMKAPNFTEICEFKVFVGFSAPNEAKQTYLAHYDNPQFFGSMETVTVEEFKRRIEESRNNPGNI